MKRLFVALVGAASAIGVALGAAAPGHAQEQRNDFTIALEE